MAFGLFCLCMSLNTEQLAVYTYPTNCLKHTTRKKGNHCGLSSKLARILTLSALQREGITVAYRFL